MIKWVAADSRYGLEFSKHGSVTRMASEINLHSCSSKWVNNQMEVNDRPMEKWR